MPANRIQMERMKARHKAIPKAVMEAIQPTLRKAAAEIVAEMQRECPVSKDSAHGNPPGALRDSITATPGGQSTPGHSQPGGSTVVGDDSVLITAGSSRVRYPHFVEYGTVKMAAEPYFFPAIRLLRERTKATISKAFYNTVAEQWKWNRRE
jgi:HK97 gp10 family phage protein